jgi:hypothetical protein
MSKAGSGGRICAGVVSLLYNFTSKKRSRGRPLLDPSRLMGYSVVASALCDWDSSGHHSPFKASAHNSPTCLQVCAAHTSMHVGMCRLRAALRLLCSVWFHHTVAATSRLGRPRAAAFVQVTSVSHATSSGKCIVRVVKCFAVASLWSHSGSHVKQATESCKSKTVSMALNQASLTIHGRCPPARRKEICVNAHPLVD